MIIQQYTEFLVPYNKNGSIYLSGAYVILKRPTIKSVGKIWHITAPGIAVVDITNHAFEEYKRRLDGVTSNMKVQEFYKRRKV